MELQKLQFGKLGNTAMSAAAHHYGLASYHNVMGDSAQNTGVHYMGKDSSAAEKYLNDAGDSYARAGKHEALSRSAVTGSVRASTSAGMPKKAGMDEGSGMKKLSRSDYLKRPRYKSD